MHYKKAWVCALCAAIFLGSNVCYANEPIRVMVNEPRIVGNIVTVSGVVPIEASGTPVSLQIVSPGGEFGVLEDVFYICEVLAAEDGSFHDTLYMEDSDETGWYTVYAGTKGYAPSSLDQKPDHPGEYVQAFYYASSDKRQAMLKRINNAANALEVQEILDEPDNRLILQSMGLLMEEYLDLPVDVVRARVGNALVHQDFADDTALSNGFNDVVIAQMLNACGSDMVKAVEVVRPYADILCLPLEQYDKLTDAAQLAFYGRTLNAAHEGEWKSASDFVQAMEDGFPLLALYREHNHENIWNVLETYADQFSLKPEDLEAFKSLDSSQARVSVYKAMTNQDFLTLDAVRDAFHNAVLSAVKLEESNQGGGNPIHGGGSGGSSSGGGRPSSQITLPPAGGNIPSDIVQPGGSPFSDLPESHWAYVPVMSLYQKGVVQGTDLGLFEPDAALTREVFVKMLVSAMELPLKSQPAGFVDVDSQAWYAPYVAAAKQYGIVNGLSDTCFGVGAQITRQDMAAMLCRAMDMMGIKVSGGQPELFADDTEIAPYAKDAVYTLKAAGLVNGMDEMHFVPEGVSTKAQAAKILDGLLKLTAA